MKNRVVIVSDGDITRMVVNGKEYRDSITAVNFHHDGHGKPEMEICTDAFPLVGQSNLTDFRIFLEKVISGQ